MPRDFFKRFLLSATEFFLDNKAVKLDVTLVFHMDVQTLEIPTYIHHYSEEYCLLNLSYRRSIQQAYYSNAQEINLLNRRYLGFINIKVHHIHRTQQYSDTLLQNIFCPTHFQNTCLWQKACGDYTSAREFCLTFLCYFTHMCLCQQDQDRGTDLH